MKSVILFLILLLLSSCDTFFSEDSTDDKSTIEKADEAFNNNDYERSKQQYAQVLMQNPNDSAGYIGLVTSYAEILKIDSMFTLITGLFNDSADRAPDEVTGMDYGFFDMIVVILEIESATHDYYNTIEIDTLFKLDSLVMDTLLYIPYRNSVEDTVEVSLLQAKVHFVAEFHEIMKKAAVVGELLPDMDELNHTFEIGQDNNLEYASIGDLERAKTDGAYRDSLNIKISETQNKLETMDTGIFLGDFTGDDSGEIDDDSSEIDDDSTSKDLAKTFRFYRIQDQKDNDGDGCVDEEIIDNKDNDGDGLVDEDVRLVELDLLDNDHNGSHESSTTNPDLREGLDPSGTYLLYLYDQLSPDYINDSFQGDSAQSVTYKRRVAYDSLKTIPLDTLKKNIGGCWNNYTER